MNFDTLLQTLEDGGTEKTAAAPKAQGPNKALKEALKQTLDKSASTNYTTPSSSNPIDDLEKLAEEIANTEKDAEIIHAANMGRAFADAALEQLSATEAKFAQFETRATTPAISPSGDVDNVVKLAAEQGYADAQNLLVESAFQEKVAYASPRERTQLMKVAQEAGREDLIIKTATAQGYQDTQEKIAAVHYAQGEESALQDVHKLASAEFIKGAQEANILIDRARQ